MNLGDLQKKLSLLQKASGITDQQLVLMEQEQERRDQALKRREEDLVKQQAERERREKEIRTSALDMVSSGRLLIEIGGIRQESLQENLSIPCPNCGAPLQNIHDPIFQFSELWYTWKDQRFGAFSPLLQTNTLYVNSLPCSGCKKSSQVIVQLVIVK